MTHRIYCTIPVAVTLVATLLALSALIQLATGARQIIDTHVAGASQHLGFHLNWDRQLQPGQTLELRRDAAMRPGYERVLVIQNDQVLGFLPEFAGAQQVRQAWQQGRLTRAELIAVDPMDPARGLKARVMISG